MSQPLIASKKRIDSIDMLRGIIMIIMALDHTRDFFHITASTADPTNPAITTPILFFTRWITHYCAPVFVFLAGTSVFLAGRKKTKKEMSVFLIKRGLWLAFLEIVIFNLIFSFDPMYHAIFLQVIWVTGISMVLMAGFIYLPVRTLFIIGIVLVAGHNLLDRFNVNAMGGGQVPVWYGLLHQQFITQYAPGRIFGGFYPLLPWPGIMMLGYCLGSLFTADYDAVKRRKQLVQIGLMAIIAFFIFRWINVYGDLVPWSEQATTTRTIISFFNVTKYPPSLLYCCMTIGPALILLAWLEKVQSGWGSIVVIYGRVPMFYYLTHFFVLHVLCTIVFFATGHNMSEAAGGLMIFRPDNFGFSLPVVYAIWIVVVAGLYPLCKRYSIYKATHDYWWLSYL